MDNYFLPHFASFAPWRETSSDPLQGSPDLGETGGVQGRRSRRSGTRETTGRPTDGRRSAQGLHRRRDPGKIAEHGLTDWYLEDGWLRRKYNTDGWPTTLMLTNAIGFLCEAAWHHADLAITWASSGSSSRPTPPAASPTRISRWPGRSRKSSSGGPSRAGRWKGRRTSSCRRRSKILRARQVGTDHAFDDTAVRVRRADTRSRAHGPISRGRARPV